jgi:hypothetical protein
MKVERPATPVLTTQLINARADQIAEDINNRINSDAKQLAVEGIGKGIATAALIGAIAANANEEAARSITSTTGSVVNSGINFGRGVVFEKFLTQIKAFQRSEIMDDKTCEICLSLDERIVKASDPMASMDLVHTNCRGIWVPIFQDEETTGSFGIPKTIENSFEKVGGVPVVNSFKQMKRPINKVSSGAIEEIKKRISAKK